MLILVCLSFAIFLCAVVPAALFCVNLRRYRAPLQPADVSNARVAVLIPARDEENNIAACLESVLASRGIELELYVLDDASTDNTAAIVERFAARDARVKLITTQQLPAGWNGKQHACWLLAGATDAPYLFFLDADVRIALDALSRCLSELQCSRVALLSGFPRQVTIGWLEQLLLPLIQFVLLAYLPMGRMRTSTKPAYAAGCGQFFLAERSAYFATGGHSAIRETRHDGLRLPQLFRRYGYRTDIVDLTTLADVRMYTSASAVWMGLAKNATEGLAAPARIVPLTLILALGQIAPALAASLWLATYSSMIVTGATFDAPLQAAAITALLTVAVIAMYLPRLMAMRRFQQPWLSALLHPFGVATLLALQWYALGKQLLRSPVAWRSRSYATGSGEEIQ